MPNTYKDIPQPGDILATSQGDIEHNFLYLANTLGTSNAKNGDHQISVNGVDNTTFEGRHRQVCFSNRNGGVPTVAGIGDGTNALLYSNNGNLFFGSATGAGAFQLTTYNSNVSTFGTNTNYNAGPPNMFGGWTFLPGGLILQYGLASDTNLSTNNTILFPIAFPNTTMVVTLGAIRSNTNDKTISVLNGSTTLTQFQVELSGSSQPNGVYWMAIGN